MLNFDSASANTPNLKVLNFLTKISQKAEYFANPSSRHSLGMAAQCILKDSRSKIAKILQVQASEIIFTSGGTEANNLMINLLHPRTSGKVVYFPAEHPSLIAPLIHLSKNSKFELIKTPIHNNRLNTEKLPELLKDAQALILSPIITEIGDRQPLKEIREIVMDSRKNNPNLLWIGDGSTAHILPKKAGYDALTFSGTKIGGIGGCAILYKNHSLKLTPLIRGGKQEFGLRAGTENLLSISCFAEALDSYYQEYLQNQSILQELKEYFFNQTESLFREKLIFCNNLDSNNNHIIHLGNSMLRGEDLMLRLSSLDLMVGNGNACNNLNLMAGNPTLGALRYNPLTINNSIRISLLPTHKKSDIDSLSKGLQTILKRKFY